MSTQYTNDELNGYGIFRIDMYRYMTSHHRVPYMVSKKYTQKGVNVILKHVRAFSHPASYPLKRIFVLEGR